jgi:hypothetical protein
MTILFRTWIAVGVIAAALAAAMVMAPTASAGPLNQPDRASVAGIHFQDLHPADVVGGTTNDLIIRWTAGRQLTDGTVRITFPGAQWGTPLRPYDGQMSAHLPLGTFSVRPYSDIPVDPAVVPPACDTLPASTPPSFGVENVGGDQLIVISHVMCAPGQSLAVLLEGVQAPASAGQQITHADLPITASDADSPARDSVARMRVMPTPNTRLHVGEVPAQVEAGVPFQVEIQALRPDGGLARHYRGTVALASSDCSMTPVIDTVAAHFTAADNGVLYVQVILNLTDNAEAHQLQVYDVANKAQPAVSSEFDVVGSVPAVQCPVAYH